VGGLDLVVAPDTAIAHLAGALGIPAWIALPRPAEWRWGRTGDTTPWYSRARLFRQDRWGDWVAVFERMADALAKSVPA
jgi:ADP-heptose:LPS heptosyltransferase